MFWERFYDLCIKNNTKPNPIAKKLNISSGLLTKWKSGATPNTDALIKIAEEFNVTTDYLLGRENNLSNSGNNNSVVTSGSNNTIQNGNNNANSFSAPIDNAEVWDTYSKLSAKDKLEIQLDILNRGNEQN